jgi:5-hydroxyisourate hydrolase-like protein (transthyretin family)
LTRIIGAALAIIMIAAAAGGWASPALADGGGAISGQIINKTAGGSPVEALEVTLITYMNGEAADVRQKAATDAAGRFEFRDLSTDNVTTYAMSVTFQDADYNTDPIALTPDGPAREVELYVYDSTTSDAGLQVSNGHIVVFTVQGALEVLEVWRFNNTGDKTFIGAEGKAGGATLRFSLPAGATSLVPGGDLTLETTDTGWVGTNAMPPGVTDINLSYFIPHQGSEVTISRKLDYPVAGFRLLVEDTGVKVSSSILALSPPQMINGTNFLNFTADNLTGVAIIDASFSGIVSPSASSPEELFPWRWLLIGAVMLAAVIGFTYPQLKRRQILANPPPASTAPPDEEALLLELARLDDAYEAGAIKEREYRERRAQTKADLTEIYDPPDGRVKK